MQQPINRMLQFVKKIVKYPLEFQGRKFFTAQHKEMEK